MLGRVCIVYIECILMRETGIDNKNMSGWVFAGHTKSGDEET